MNEYKFRYSPKNKGFMNKEDFNNLIWAGTVISHAIFNPPSSGETIDGVDYLPVDYTEDPKIIAEAMRILNSFYGGIIDVEK